MSKTTNANQPERLPQSQKTIDEAVPRQLVVESIKKSYQYEDEDVGVNDPKQTENLKRNERKNVGKIKKAEGVLDDKIYENYVKTEKKKSLQDIQLITNCLKKHFVFYNLSTIEIKQIIDKMFFCETPGNEMIFKQGDNASSYLIIAKGAVQIIINEKPVRNLKTGDGFGELALLYSAPRSASAKTLEPAGFWAIDRVTFRKHVEEIVQRDYAENRAFIDNVAFFNSMTSDQKDAIAGVLISEHYGKGDTVVNEGDPASSFYIIKEGLVTITKAGKEIRKMTKGESFGEQALYYNTVRGCSVKAIEEVKCLSLGRDTLTKILGDQVQIITFRNIQKWAFEKNAILSKLTKIQIEKILDNTKYSNKKAGEIVYSKNQLGSSKLVIVIEGSLKKSKYNSVIAKKGELYGDEFVLEATRTKVIDDDIVMEQDGVVGELPYSTFIECIGGTLEAAMKKNENGHEKKMMQNHNSEMKKNAANLRLEDLVFYKKLGFGQFGSVYLVKCKGDEQFFALKAVSKQQVIEGSLETHLLQEKTVLEAVNFPFIMQFIRTYKDTNFIYFLVEYIKGMELFDVIRDMNLLETKESQFYTGQLLLAIEYLHTQGIIYRDLKPENIMVDSKGYLKLIDMGTAKFLKGKSGPSARTFTIIGTPHYMAPEILTNKGYSYYVDLWSIGVVLYEFMCGRVPFGEDADDPYEIYEEVITKPLTYPNFLKDKKARRLMDQLINKVPEVRLGGAYASLKAHPWFDNFDWDKLLDKQLPTPYLPPKEKMISDGDVRKMENAGKKVIDEIDADLKGNFKKYKKDQARDQNWDKAF
jgi:cGMP-dependent protein kinase